MRNLKNLVRNLINLLNFMGNWMRDEKLDKLGSVDKIIKLYGEQDEELDKLGSELDKFIKLYGELNEG